MLRSNRGKKCPYTRKDCLESDCMFWGELKGKDPTTGQHETVYGCVQVLSVFLLRDLGKRLDEVSASTDKLCNETTARQDIANRLAYVTLKEQARLPDNANSKSSRYRLSRDPL